MNLPKLSSNRFCPLGLERDGEPREETPTTWSLSEATRLLELAAKTGTRYAARKEKDRVRNRTAVTVFEAGRWFMSLGVLPSPITPYSYPSKTWPLFRVSLSMPCRN